jgi:DNA repair protein SbcC/Rad50
VTGPNGAGKSTLIEAVTWCLFGHEAARTQKEFLKRAAAAPGEDVEVRLEFDLDGVAYVVSRRLRGRSQQTEAQVEADGALLVAPGANSSDLATKRIAKALGMDRRGFQATVVAQQGDLSALSDTNPGERKRLVLGLLGIDEIDAAIAFARTRKREAAIRLDEVRRGLAREAGLRERLEAATKELEATAAQREALALEAARRAEGLARLEKEEAALAQLRQAQRDLRARLDGLQRALHVRQEQATRLGSEVQLLEQRQQELARLQDEAARFADLDERLAELEAYRSERAQREPLEAERAALMRELRRWETADAPVAAVGPTGQALVEEVRSLRSSIERAAGDLAQLEAHAQHVDVDRRRLQSDAADEADRWRELEALGPEAACPLCERVLGDAIGHLVQKATAGQADRRTRLEALSQERERLRVQADARRREQEADRSRLAEHERLLETLRMHEERLEVAKRERERLRRRLSDVEGLLAARPPAPVSPPDAAELEVRRAARDRWRQAVARLEADAARTGRLRTELAATHAEAEATRHEIEAASREFAQSGYRDGAWEEAHRACEDERTRLHDVERRRDVLAERASGLEAQAHRARLDLASFEATREEAAELEDQVRLGELLAADRGDQGLLPEFKRHLIGRVRPALARAAADLVLEMTQGRYAELAIDEDYTIRVYEGATAWPLERFSGGEVDVINLAVRLAVSELLARARRSSRLQFVALDEVLAGQDETRRRSVLGALKRLGTHFRQVLLVTHLDEVRERVDHVIRVVPQPDGTSALVPSWGEAGPAAGPLEAVAEADEPLAPTLEP